MPKITLSHKNDLLALIRRAKSSHIRWRSYAQALVGGVPVDNEKLPVKHTDCRFGQWYFGEGMGEFGKMEIYRDIQGPHEMLHAIYAQIHDLVQQRQFDIAHGKIEQLVGISLMLLGQLDVLEKEVDAMAS